MKIILDVNVILSALIRDSTTRKIILNSQFDFYFPEPSLHKIRKYKDYILKKSGLTEEEYNKIMATLFKYIKLVPTEEIEKNWDKAKKIIEHIDKEDVIFILQNSKNTNVVGNQAVKLCVELGLITEEDIIKIQDTAHALIINI